MPAKLPVSYNLIMRYCLFLATVVTSIPGFAADVKVMDEIVCKVNGDIITRTELDRDRKRLEADMKQQGLNGTRLQDALQQYTPNLLRERIDQLLLIQKAKELNFKVDSDVNKELAEIQKNAASGKPELADPEKFQQFVREQTGMSYEDYKGERANFHLSQRVIREEVGRRVTFKKEELRTYYDAHREEFKRNERIFLREIVISTEGKTDPQALAAAEKKAKDLVAQARRGARFPELAQNNSDSATARQGGALEPYEKGVLSEQLEALVWNQERGYVTDPIRISNGFMILKIDDHQQAGIPEYEAVEGEINERLFQSRMDPALRAYLTKLRETAFLEIKAGYEDSGAAPGKNTAWTDPAELKPETVTKEEVIGKGHRKRLLWTIPIPGTNTTGGTSSSR